MAIRQTSKKEQDYFHRICVQSKKDQDTVRDVLKALYYTMVTSYHGGETELYIPYIGKFKVDIDEVIKFYDKRQVCGNEYKAKVEMNLSDPLEEDFIAIHNGDDTYVAKEVKESLRLKLMDILDLVEEHG